MWVQKSQLEISLTHQTQVSRDFENTIGLPVPLIMSTCLAVHQVFSNRPGFCITCQKKQPTLHSLTRYVVQQNFVYLTIPTTAMISFVAKENWRGSFSASAKFFEN